MQTTNQHLRASRRETAWIKAAAVVTFSASILALVLDVFGRL